MKIIQQLASFERDVHHFDISPPRESTARKLDQQQASINNHTLRQNTKSKHKQIIYFA